MPGLNGPILLHGLLVVISVLQMSVPMRPFLNGHQTHTVKVDWVLRGYVAVVCAK